MMFFSSKVSVCLFDVRVGRKGGQKKKRMANHKSNLDTKAKMSIPLMDFQKFLFTCLTLEWAEKEASGGRKFNLTVHSSTWPPPPA